MTHGPIENQHEPVMNALAAVLDDTLKPFGFCLLVFDKNTSDGRMNYICNCDREDMVTAMKEFIANHEGRMLPPAGARQ
jgi:hypothetical protein